MQVARGFWGIVVAVGLGLSLAACGVRAGHAGQGEIPESLGADGTTIVVGDADAGTTVLLYEDLRCPVCGEFETRGAGEELGGLVQGGYAQVHYTLASFLDDRLAGDGSKRAANALRAALEEDKFVEYHQILFRFQPEEAVDGFTDEYLLSMASLVEGLRGPEFDDAVRTMKYQSFVHASQIAFDSSVATGTPTMLVSGTERRSFEVGHLADWVTEPAPSF